GQMRQIVRILLFYQPAAVHRDLHPFPTRRSSDLQRRPRAAGRRGARRRGRRRGAAGERDQQRRDEGGGQESGAHGDLANAVRGGDRKSTRLNSSHLVISYAVFCLKKETLWPLTLI